MRPDQRSRRFRDALARTSPGGSLWLVKWLLLVVLLVLVILTLVFRDELRSVHLSTDNATAWQSRATLSDISEIVLARADKSCAVGNALKPSAGHEVECSTPGA